MSWPTVIFVFQIWVEYGTSSSDIVLPRRIEKTEKGILLPGHNLEASDEITNPTKYYMVKEKVVVTK